MAVTFDLTRNYFSLFDLPAGMKLDREQLQERYRELQRQWHPDRFALESDSDKRVVMQAAAFINQAFQALQSPVSRAQYLLEMQGRVIDAEKNAVLPPVFLMQQMELHEALDEAQQVEDLLPVQREVKVLARDAEDEFMEAFDQQSWEDAELAWQKMRFVHKLAQQIKHKEEQLDDY